MRARTTRLKSLCVGIVVLLRSGHGPCPPAAMVRGVPKGADADPGVRPPLPPGNPRWGRVGEVGRGPPARQHNAPGGRRRQEGRNAFSDSISVMSFISLLVGTRKGAFIVRGDRARRRWALSDPIFLGH